MYVKATDKNDLSSAPVSFIISLIIVGGRPAGGVCLSECDLFIEYKSSNDLSLILIQIEAIFL